LVDRHELRRWIEKAVSLKTRTLLTNEITISEASGNCLRKAYYSRTHPIRDVALEFVKLSGDSIHQLIQEVLRSEGWLTEVEARLEIVSDGGQKILLRGRADAVRGNEVLEFKSTKALPDRPYDSHKRQLGAYMILLGAERGYIIYISREDGRYRIFEVSREEAKGALKEVVERAKILHKHLVERRPPPREKGPWCGSCEFRGICFSSRE